MKLSKYSFVIKRGSDYVLYNCWTEKMAVLEDRLREWLESGDVDHIQDIHPEFYDYLLREQFIVDNEVNEAEEVIRKWKEEEGREDCLSLMVNSTLDCNMRCWYCYEKHRANTDLTPETVSSMLKLIRKRITNPKLKSVHISFFGGEPLLNFERIVWPFLKQINDIRNEYHKQFSISFTSNSYLLSNEIIGKMNSLNLSRPIVIQVTLDGNEEIHNKTRHVFSGEGTYKKILSNIQLSLNKGIQVVLRFNCTGHNIRTFVDVLADMKDWKAQEKTNLTIDLQQVWQDSARSDIDMPAEQNKLRSLFLKEGFTVNPLKAITPFRCYADNANHFIVNYNGDLYKCSARDFIKENREGFLTSNGDLEWNEKRTLREKLKYGNPVCLACKIYPLCHGGCSQAKLENERNMTCLKQYSDYDKVKIIKSRVEFLLERFV